MKKLFLDLSNRITQRCPQVKVVDLDRKQIDRYEDSPSIEFPAVLLRISIPSTDDINSDEQMVDVDIQARIVLGPEMGETSSITPEKWRVKALEDLDVIDQINNALHGFSTDELAPLSRQSTTPENRSDDLVVYASRFTGSYCESFE